MFYVITKGSTTTEKRLIIDIATPCEPYNKQNILKYACFLQNTTWLMV